MTAQEKSLLDRAASVARTIPYLYTKQAKRQAIVGMLALHRQAIACGGK